MTYTTTITKTSVNKINDRDYAVVINVVVNDGTKDVFTQSFTERYDEQISISQIETSLQNKIRDAWDKYIAEKSILEAVAFDTVCSSLETALNTYSNA